MSHVLAEVPNVDVALSIDLPCTAMDHVIQPVAFYDDAIFIDHCTLAFFQVCAAIPLAFISCSVFASFRWPFDKFAIFLWSNLLGLVIRQNRER